MKTLCVVLLALVVFANAFSYSGKTFEKKDQVESLKFWTTEMMKKAVPMETLISQKLEEKVKSEMVNDKVEPNTDYVKPDSKYQTEPYNKAGKVFFLYGGRPASCSGSSSGNNVVLTAAHCIFLEGSYHEKWVFVPQYNSGNRPAGTWTAKEFLMFEEWRNQDMGRDVAFVVTSKQNGKSLEDTVGKIQIGTCDVEDQFLSLGYPGPDWGAEKMVQTVGKIARRFPFSPWTPAPLGMRSKQGPGSSGGPWISPAKNAENKLVACSVNSFLLRFTYYVFGPFFDQDVLDLHKVAIARE
jgi:V8-like Glu-specific endopeptidase